MVMTMSDGHSDAKRYSRFYGEFGDQRKITAVEDIEIVLKDGAVHSAGDVTLVVGDDTYEMSALIRSMRRIGWI